MNLLETVAVLALEGMLLAVLTAALIGSTAVTQIGSRSAATVVARRHLEHLLDRTFSAAGRGAAAAVPILRASAAEVIVQADLDGDGRIDPRSAERTSLELRAAGPDGLRLLHRIGRQTVGVDDGIAAYERFRYYDSQGRPALRIDQIRLAVVATSGGPLYFVVAAPR